MKSERLDWLDAARGCAVVALFLCLFAGDPTHLPAIVRGSAVDTQASENFGLFDLLMPMFLLLIGASLVPAMKRWRTAASHSSRVGTRGLLRVARRVLLLVVMGLFLNGFPDYNLAELRLPGPLQLLAVAYLACFLIVYFASGKLMCIASILLLVQALAQSFINAPGVDAARFSLGGGIGPWLDRNLFGAEHLGYGQDTLAYDPMGVVALLPAIALTLLGYSACQTFIERMRKSEGSARVGLLASALIGIGWILGRWVPIVPSEWTAPYALIAAGWGLLGCALWHELVTGVGWTALAHPFRILGRNAILVYAGGVLTMDLAGRITVPSDEGGKVHLLDWFANAAWRSWASEPVAAVLLALTVLGVWWLVALALAKGKVYISL